MHKGELILSHSRISARQLALGGLLVCVFFAPATTRSLAVALGQEAPVKSKIELELEKKNNPSPNPPVNKKGRRSSSSEDRIPLARDYSVSFASDVVGADILLDGTLIGKIGPDKKLSTRVKRGQHKVTASLKGYNPNSMTISVVSDRMAYTLNLGNPLPVTTPAPAPVVKVEPTPVPSPPTNVTADDILSRFVDTKETGTLTAEDWKSLISQTEEVLKQEPNQGKLTARLHLARGQLAYLDHKYAESLTEFNHAIVALPQSGIAFYGLGNVYLATNQPIQAMKTYQQALELTPETSAIALQGIGDALVQLDKPKEAIATYQRSRDHGNLSPELNKGIASSYIKQKQWQKALTELDPIEAGDVSGDIHIYLGECYENLKRPLSAYRAYILATKLAPGSPLAFSKLGTLLYEHNEFHEAKEALERALALDTTGNIINRQMTRKMADSAASQIK